MDMRNAIYVGTRTSEVSTRLLFFVFTDFVTELDSTRLQSQKRASCNNSVDILLQLVTTSPYQNAFAWLATAFDNKSVASCRQACCKLIISTDLLQLDEIYKLVATC